jgi:hypothetical protein
MKFEIRGLYFVLILLSSCSFVPYRSYQDEMDRNDQAFFEPESDFPIVAGDSGTTGRTKKEINARTPLSHTEKRALLQRRQLIQERKDLESSLDDQEKAYYQKYRSSLTTESEKIYFLKLNSYRDQQEYIRSRGLDIQSRPIDLTDHWQSADLNLGMTKNEVQSSWGEPLNIDIAGNPVMQNERWIYRRSGALKAVFFENGRVEGWSTQSQ